MELMIDDFVTFFIAGQETTANALAFAFLEMGKHPEIVAKAREEIDRVLGERSEVTYEDVNELKYCLAIFKETLRLYPPIQQAARRTTEKLHINGYIVPEDTDLFVGEEFNIHLLEIFITVLTLLNLRFLFMLMDEAKSSLKTHWNTDRKDSFE